MPTHFQNHCQPGSRFLPFFFLGGDTSKSLSPRRTLGDTLTLWQQYANVAALNDSLLFCFHLFLSYLLLAQSSVFPYNQLFPNLKLKFLICILMHNYDCTNILSIDFIKFCKIILFY